MMLIGGTWILSTRRWNRLVYERTYLRLLLGLATKRR
jgi:hypothetical protein